MGKWAFGFVFLREPDTGFRDGRLLRAILDDVSVTLVSGGIHLPIEAPVFVDLTVQSFCDETDIDSLLKCFLADFIKAIVLRPKSVAHATIRLQ